jgi:predicted transcriptional regulator
VKRSKADEDYLKRLGAHIRKLRRSRGYSQDRLYLEAGFSSANMARIEKGEVAATILTLRRIARTLGFPVKKLLDFE